MINLFYPLINFEITTPMQYKNIFCKRIFWTLFYTHSSIKFNILNRKNALRTLSKIKAFSSPLANKLFSFLPVIYFYGSYFFFYEWAVTLFFFFCIGIYLFRMADIWPSFPTSINVGVGGKYPEGGGVLGIRVDFDFTPLLFSWGETRGEFSSIVILRRGVKNFPNFFFLLFTLLAWYLP